MDEGRPGRTGAEWTQPGAVCASSQAMACSASSRLPRHRDCVGRREPHTAGRSACPKMRQRSAASSWTQRTPAGLPSGMPGIGLEMDGAMQQAPHASRHGTGASAWPGWPISAQFVDSLTSVGVQAAVLAVALATAGSAQRGRHFWAAPLGGVAGIIGLLAYVGLLLFAQG